MRVNPKTILLTAWIFSLSLTGRVLIQILYYDGGIGARQFGNYVKINLPTILITVIFMLALLMGNRKWVITKKKNSLTPFLFCLLARAIIPINMNYNAVLVGALNIFYYLLTYCVLYGLFSLDEIKKGINAGFSLLCITEIATGLLYYLGIIIPFFTSIPSDYERNGMVRMQGTLTHPGEFSLMMGIMFIYFACEFFYGKKKSAFFLMLCAYVGVYFSYARTALIVVTVILCVMMWINYRTKILARVIMVIVVIVALQQLLTSDLFINLFITTSIEDMLQARFLHWIIGWRIMSRNALNFLLGVGVNNNVDYIAENYDSLMAGLSNSAILTSSFAKNNPIHNSYFVIGAEAGILLMGIYIKTLLKMIIDSIKRFHIGTEDSAKSAFLAYATIWYAIYAVQGWGALGENALLMLSLLSIFYVKLEE